MYFTDTRSGKERVTASQAIIKGLSLSGGLYVPESFPTITKEEILQLCECDYPARAAFILHRFFGEFSYEFLLDACKKAYSRFDMEDPAQLVALSDEEYVLELYHGPTYAFKDVALTLLPYLMDESLKLNGIKKSILILSATSGDTGKAALESFKDIPNTKIMVFYPENGVSDMQKLQMSTQEGENVFVCAVDGNFDDCQTAVKRFMNDKDCLDKALSSGYIVSSANSINIGRLAPQIVYYFSAYCDLLSSNTIAIGDTINFSVPTGNFGNILAGWYAKKMGLPIEKLICASNKNNVLTDFFNKGLYDVSRQFYRTESPSMDILISSNLERLVYEITGRDPEVVMRLMNDLSTACKYKIDGIKFSTKDFYAGWSSDDDAMEFIAEFFDDFGYLADPHTAVGIKVATDYFNQTKDDRPIVYLSTASPYKFPTAVYYAIAERKTKDAFDAIKRLFNESGMEIPNGLATLQEKPIRFTKVVEKQDVPTTVFSFLGK